MAENISFLSSGATGISPDIRIIKDYLLSIDGSNSFSFFSKNEAMPTKGETMEIKLQKVDFCSKAEHILCIDASLPIRDMFGDSPYSRILLTGSYDYIFKHLLGEKSEKKNVLSNFTHIIYTSPITKKAIEQAYNIDNIKTIDGYASPFAADICNPDSIDYVYRKLSRIYPQLNGKKVVSIVRTGTKYEKSALDNLDLESMLENLDDSYVLVTNASEIISKAHTLSNKHKGRVVYIDLLASANELLYISNALITNNSYLAGAFSAKRMPLYHIDYCENYFAEYMRKNSKSSFPVDAGKIAEEISGGNFDTSICNELSYSPDKCSNEIINEIVKIKA